MYIRKCLYSQVCKRYIGIGVVVPPLYRLLFVLAAIDNIGVVVPPLYRLLFVLAAIDNIGVVVPPLYRLLFVRQPLIT